ncbi:hypothetical protein SASPL_110096 [Salvia splendens]|uniref:Uncharacterized protein n=1 Tax=Salvia splendens TaxID=180675 RepID=A0A8X8Y4U9_SALSN|nr:hypothetical protein SASPL_110096 [Salvia splendens]
MLFMDSKSETEVEDVCGDDASNSDTTGVSISSIALLGEKHGVEEDRAVSPADYQVSASKEIYWSCSSDVNSILSTAPLSAATLLSDVDRDFKCLLQGHTQDEWDICLIHNSSEGRSVGDRDGLLITELDQLVNEYNMGMDDALGAAKPAENREQIMRLQERLTKAVEGGRDHEEAKSRSPSKAQKVEILQRLASNSEEKACICIFGTITGYEVSPAKSELVKYAWALRDFVLDQSLLKHFDHFILFSFFLLVVE